MATDVTADGAAPHAISQRLRRDQAERFARPCARCYPEEAA